MTSDLLIQSGFGLGMFARDGGASFSGIVLAGDKNQVRVVPITDLGDGSIPKDMITLLSAWEENFARLQIAATGLDGRVGESLESFQILPPVPSRQILCTGMNYRSHVIDILVAQPSSEDADLSLEERRAKATRLMDERAASGTPYAFSKLPSCMVGANDAVSLPANVQQPDWELELAIMIGREARNVTRDRAMDHVAGYCIANDVSARDHFYRPDIPALASDPLAGKSCPTFLPIGPWITPAAYVRDYRSLSLHLSVNGQKMQQGEASDMIFDIERQVEYLSHRIRLLPGDVICTGSPAGNGIHHGVFLKPGDVMEAEISGLGTMQNVCVAEVEAAP